MKRTIFIITALILLAGLNPAQSRAGSKATSGGSKLISGALSFTSQGGDLYESYSNERLNVISVTPSMFYFVSPGFGVGGDLSYERRERGGDSYTTMVIGPKVGYFADTGSDMIPFFTGGVGYYLVASNGESRGGVRFKFGGGMLVRKGHLAFSIEATFMHDRLNLEGDEGSTTGNTILVGVGLAGFLFD